MTPLYIGAEKLSQSEGKTASGKTDSKNSSKLSGLLTSYELFSEAQLSFLTKFRLKNINGNFSIMTVN